uniref:Uncharacterized protein n=1 Tax=Hyaloperonospora arabidopsidis (strain Emoy2) TaxID=559515 RepID=M4BWT6_HYAAE
MPENEVDYWQPMPWDRKVPKTRLCGPCCWKKFRRPLEPFHTWWRHENYFTWIFCPYRNEQLSRGERALIVVCSLYITFYVLFIIVMLRDSWGADMTIFRSVVLYAILISILPPAGKAGFKELFKLIFRQRRKYFRAKAAGVPGGASTHGRPGSNLLHLGISQLFVLEEVHVVWSIGVHHANVPHGPRTGLDLVLDHSDLGLEGLVSVLHGADQTLRLFQR